MTPINRLNSIKAWCSLQAKVEDRWWKPWNRGYTAACKDLLLLLESDISIMPLNEYKALEGYYEEVYGRKDS